MVSEVIELGNALLDPNTVIADAIPACDNYAAIVDRFVKARKIAQEANAQRLVSELQTEVIAFSFHWRQGGLRDQYGFVDANGKEHHWPNFDLLDDSALEYLRNRASKTSDPIARARYLLVLWCHPRTRHNDFARKFLETAETAIHILLGDRGTIAKRAFLFLELWTASVYFKVKLKQSLVGVEQSLVDFVSNPNTEPSRRAQIWSNAAYETLRLSIPRKTRKQLASQLLSAGNDLLSGWSHRAGESYILESLIRLGKTADFDVATLQRSLAEYHLMLFSKSERKGDPSTLAQLEKAIRLFEEAGDKKEADRLVHRYQQHSRDIDLQTFEGSFDVEDLIILQGSFAEHIVQLDLEGTFRFLIEDDRYLPETMERVAETVPTESALVSLLEHRIIDQDGLPLGRESSFSLQVANKIYRAVLTLVTVPSIVALFRHPSLSMDTWDSHFGEDEKLWPVLRPSLVWFPSVLYNSKSDSVVLLIDSVVLKVEAILRALYEKHKVSHLNHHIKGNDLVMSEQALPTLVNAPELIGITGERFAGLLRFLFSRDEGLGVRDNVAHGRLLRTDYDYSMTVIVIFVAVRLMTLISEETP